MLKFKYSMFHRYYFYSQHVQHSKSEANSKLKTHLPPKVLTVISISFLYDIHTLLCTQNKENDNQRVVS